MNLFRTRKNQSPSALSSTENALLKQGAVFVTEATVRRVMDTRAPGSDTPAPTNSSRLQSRAPRKRGPRRDGRIRLAERQVGLVEQLFQEHKEVVCQALVSGEDIPDMTLHFDVHSELEAILRTQHWGRMTAPISHPNHSCHPLWQEFVRWAAYRCLRVWLHRENDAQGAARHLVRLAPLWAKPPCDATAASSE